MPLRRLQLCGFLVAGDGLIQGTGGLVDFPGAEASDGSRRVSLTATAEQTKEMPCWLRAPIMTASTTG